MERKTVAGLGAAAAAGTLAGTISLDGVNVSLNLAETGPVVLLAIVLLVLVAFMIVSLVKGWVIVKLHYDTLVTRAEKAEEANATLSARQLILTETNATLVRTIEKQDSVGETVTKLVHAIQDARLNAGGSS